MKKLTIVLALLVAVSLGVFAQGQGGGGGNQDPWAAGTFNNFRLRAVGPAIMSGRINVVAVHPEDKQTWYIGVASGGVWKTTNAGTTFTPVFQNEGSYSIGHVVIDAKNPNTIWVGTGEANNQRSVGWGDGIYRSDDAGRSWRNLGLKDSQHIGRIVIDPRDSKVVYVAAYGPLWSAGGDRGLYKTTDGGATWNRILNISEHTGISDVIMDPTNPDVLIATAHQRRRHTWTLIHGGPESGLHKSTDGGATWRRIRTGLPGGDLGRIVPAFSPARKGLVYAKVESADGPVALYASNDSGESWERRAAVNAQPMYYENIHPDPKDADRIYVPSVQSFVSDDGGRNFRQIGERNKHVDNHVIWVDPDNTQHLIEGSDGGLYESWDGGRLWRHFSNLSVTQFYNVEVDNVEPIYNIYGGTQDNSTLGGPSRSKGPNGSTNNDWFVVTGGDGFVVRIDPSDPNIVYAESQYGGIVRLDKRTSERVSIRPAEDRGEAQLRFNWESPFIISAHQPSRLYFGASRLFRSDDRGSSWKPISPDLTRQTDRNTLPVMGRQWSPEAIAQHQSTATWGNISTVAESRRREGVMIVGTDDGLTQVSIDGGANWRRSERPPGLPDYGNYGVYVQEVATSKHDEQVMYSLYENTKNGDFKPYIYKSTNRGGSWESISSDLPANAPVLSFAEDHVNPNLLFVGTEHGLFFTVDGGKKWIRLRSNLPTIAVRDLAIQERENDLVLATFGRGFYVLDDYSPLRQLAQSTFDRDGHFFPTKRAVVEVPEQGKSRGSQGENLWMSENRYFGALITYWVKESPRSLRQRRQDQARAAEAKNASPRYPTQAELTAEADEEAAQTLMTITDSAGRVVRRMTVPGARGIHRYVWNLRSTAPTTGGGGFGGGGGGDQDPPIFQGNTGGGSFVPPGTYRVALSRRVDGSIVALGEPQSLTVVADPGVTLTPAQRTANTEYHANVDRLQRSFTGTLEAANAMRTRTQAIQRALVDSPADVKMLDEARRFDTRVLAILRRMRGDETLRGLESGDPSSLQDRVNTAVQGARGLSGAPTGTQQRAYAIANEDLAAVVKELRGLEAEIRKFEQQLEASGVPYTPGRWPGQ
ncbi:MAG: VPS10 domain-containing protein [Acidimicrobiia bacterium]